MYDTENEKGVKGEFPPIQTVFYFLKKYFD